MSTLRTGRRWPPLSLLCLFFLVALLFGSYRSCQEAVRDTYAGRLLPRTPPPGGSGVAVMGSMQLSQAPRYVQRVAEHLRRIRHWHPLQGYRGGRVYRNFNGRLPAGRTYYEYDVHPLRPGVSRGAERLIVDESKELFFYTRDHYSTFTELLVP